MSATGWAPVDESTLAWTPVDEQKPKPTFVGPAKSIQAAPKPFTWPWAKQELTNFEEGATKSLPAIGATIGGILGAPGGIWGSAGGAGIGGMGGAAAKQLSRRALGFVDDAPKTLGEAASDITREGLTQGLVTGLTEGAGRLAGPLRARAITQYERALAPTTRPNKVIAEDITPEMIRRGQMGSLEGLEKRAGQKIAQINPKLNTQYAQLQGTGKIVGSGDQVIADLEQLKQSYMPEGITAQPQAVSAIEGIQKIVKQYGPDISPNSLRRLRQIFEEVPAQRGAYAGADLSTNYTLNAQQHAADSIRGILNKSPNIGELNKEISFWLDVQRVTRESGLRRTGQEGGLMKVLGPLGTGVAGSLGFIAGGAEGSLEAGGLAAATALAVRIARTPTYRTMSAVAKDRLASALASGNFREVSALAARIGIANGTASHPNPQPILGARPGAPLTPLGQPLQAGTP